MLLKDKVVVIHGCRRSHRQGCCRHLRPRGRNPEFPIRQDEFRSFIEDMTLLQRLPTLADLANAATFLASDKAAAMTGTMANLSCGISVD